MNETIKNEGISVKALNFSLTYADKVFASDVKGYAKIAFLSQYFRLAYDKEYKVDSKIFSYISEDYDLRSSRVFDYMTADKEFLSEEDQKEQGLTIEFMNYVAFINTSILEAKSNVEFDESKRFDIKKIALGIVNNELDRDLSSEDITSEEAYEAYRSETEKKVGEIDTVILKLG